MDVTILYCCHYLSEDSVGFKLSEGPLFFKKSKQFSSPEVLHDYDNLHIGEGETVENFDNVGMEQGLEVLYLSEEHVNVPGTC